MVTNMNYSYPKGIGVSWFYEDYHKTDSLAQANHWRRKRSFLQPSSRCLFC